LSLAIKGFLLIVVASKSNFYFIIIFGNKKTPAEAGVFMDCVVRRLIHLQRRKHPARAGWYGNGYGGGCFCWKSFSRGSLM